MSLYDENQAQRISLAVTDFRRARQKAVMENLIGALTGRDINLLPYDEVRKHMRPLESASRSLEDIPLSAIVGSVNRYHDFSRTFLPRQESDMGRWARVRAGVDSMQGLPPIEVYRVGDAYFVLDGHHRVSVAKEMGYEIIHAYVTPVYTRVPLSPGDRPDDLILKAEYSEFLAETRIDELRPGTNLTITAPGQYAKLCDHIKAHQYLMGVEHKRDVPYHEAVSHWYDHVYQPIVKLIQERDLLRDFPGRTETDLYLFIMEHRSSLGGHQLGFEASPEITVEYIRTHFGQSLRARLPRIIRQVKSWLIPDPFEPGPPTGAWRREHISHPHRDNRMFDDLLVTVPGNRGWPVVDLAINFARRDEARLTGLHVVSRPEAKNSEAVEAMQAEFARRCTQAGVAGRLIIETGNAARQLYERSSWMDLVVFRMNYPPPDQPLARLRSGVRTLIRRSQSPLLAVPDAAVRFNSAMLAYGGGPRADEALFMATYLAGRWGLPLTVTSVLRRDHVGPSPIAHARAYLEEHGISATYVEERGDPANVLSLNAEEHSSDLIITGAYEGGLLKEATRGSTLDRLLRTIRRPVLICS
jgi:nucleotide-binding universal stress UspA family protein